jgi:hypothetical protein
LDHAKKCRINFEKPANIRPHRGGIQVALN